MFLKAAINGGRGYDETPHVPMTPAQIAADALRAHRAGADVVHAHARTAAGAQTIDPEHVGAMVRAVRDADPSIVIGTTTGLWTCSGHEERMELVRSWPADALPDFASAAFSEEGADEIAQLILDRGMILESAVWSPEEVPALLASPTLHSNVRILIEPEVEDPDDAVAMCRSIARTIREAGVTCPVLYHGYDQTTWPVLRAAAADGVESRIGIEDILTLEDGTVADNLAMIAAVKVITGEASI